MRTPWWLAAAIFLTSLGLVRCAPLPDMVNQERTKEDYSADQVREMTVDQPFLMSGDYFRQRDQAPSVVLGGDPKAPEKTASSEKPSDPSSAMAGKTPVPATAPKSPSASTALAGAEFPMKIGVIIDRRHVAEALAIALARAVSETAIAWPVVMADQEKMDESLAGGGCATGDLACVAGALARYPGVRMLALVESLGEENGEMVARVGVVDSGIGFRWPIMEIRVPAGDVRTAFHSICNNVLEFAVTRSRIMPWFCRIFSKDGDYWFLTAGEESGLKPGDVLAVTAPGRLVKNPSGMPAGWLPGPEKGRLVVLQTFGADFAACSLESGGAPEPADLVMKP